MSQRSALPLTHSDSIVFQVVTLRDIIATRIRVLWSDLSEPLRGTDERIGTGPGVRNETLAQTRAEEEAVVWGVLRNSCGFALDGFKTARC